MLRQANRKELWRLAKAVFGTFLYSAGLNLFVVPLGLYTGGLMGLCQLLRSGILLLLGMESLQFDFAGVILYVINVPLLLLAWRSLGGRYFRNTVICSTTCSLFLSLLPVPAVPIIADVLTSCLVGGIISGLGIGMTLTCGASAGGSELLGMYFSCKGARFSIGQFNLGLNLVLFTLFGLLFSVETMIYSILNAVVLSMAIDRAHKQSVNVQVLIFTKKDTPELDALIMNKLYRGMTRWEGKGGYTGDDTHILCVCLNKYEIEELRTELYKVDPNAFFIIQEGVHVSSNFQRRLY